MVLNGLDVVPYLKLCWNIVTGNENAQTIKKLSVVALGRSHVIKEFCNWPEVCKSNESLKKRAWKVAFGKVVQSRTLEECRHALELFFRISCFHSSAGVDAALLEIQQEIVHCTDCSEVCWEQVVLWEEEDTIRESSPFIHWSRKIMESVMTQNDIESVNINAFRNDALAQRLLNSLCPFLPMFTGLMYSPMRYADKQHQDNPTFQNSFSEGATERWMGVVKNDIMETQKFDHATFIERLFQSVRGRHHLLLNELTAKYSSSSFLSEKEALPLSSEVGHLLSDGNNPTSPERSHPDILSSGDTVSFSMEGNPNIFQRMKNFMSLDDNRCRNFQSKHTVEPRFNEI
jgi:hypothetical protein